MTKPTEPIQDNGDPVIDAVRAARHRISARFGHDTSRLVAHYIERQRENAHRLIPAPDIEADVDRPAA